MDFNWKMMFFLLILGLIIFINMKFKNIIVRGYNYFSQFPKLILIGIGIIAVCAPFLLKNNSLLLYFRDFLPDSMNQKLDIINNKNYRQPSPVMPGPVMVNNGGRRKKITGTTRDVRKVSEQLKKMVAANQEWRCLKCGQMLDATYEVDHIMALEDGGGNEITNLQALCRNCHGKKSMNDNIKRRYPGGRIF